MLLTFIIPSPPHSFIPGLKPSFSANPSNWMRVRVRADHGRRLFFSRTDSTDSPDCLPTFLSISVFFYFLVFLILHFLVVISVR